MYLLIVPYISCTQLLLGYLPPSRELWEKELMENRLKYAKLKEELLLCKMLTKLQASKLNKSIHQLHHRWLVVIMH